MSSSSSPCFFFPQILHATYAKAPRSAAPTIPTTTPMIVFLEDVLNPELVELLFCPLTLGIPVEVTLAVEVTGTTELLVRTEDMVWPLLTVVNVVTTATVLLPVSVVAKIEVTG